MLTQPGGYVVQQPQIMVSQGGMTAPQMMSVVRPSQGSTVIASQIQGIQQAQTYQQYQTVTHQSYQTQAAALIPNPTVEDNSKIKATEAVEVAHTMRGEIGLMEETIIELQRENELLKARIIGERRGSLEKFFAANSRLLSQESIKAWKEYTEEMRSLRALELATSSQQQEALEHDKLMGQMNREADGLAKALEDVQKEDKDAFNQLVEKEQLLNADEQEGNALAERIRALEEELRETRQQENNAKVSTAGMLKRLQKAEKIVKLVNEITTFYEDEDGLKDQPGVPIAMEKILKDQLHKVLRDTDKNYIPPLDKLDTLFGPDTSANVQRTTTPVVRQRSMMSQGAVVTQGGPVLVRQQMTPQTMAREMPVQR